LTSAHAHVNAYKYAMGGSWFTVRITGESTAEDGALQIDADVFISTKKADTPNSRGFSMEADLRVTYISSAFALDAKGRVVISDECDSMELLGTIEIGGPAASDQAATARLGGAMGSLKARAIVIIPCRAEYVDDAAGRSGDALSTQITPADPGMTVQGVNVSAMIDAWKIGSFTVTDAIIAVDAVLRSDGAFTIMVDVAGHVVFDTMAGAGPSGLGGNGVTVDSSVSLRLGKTTFCVDCALELIEVDVRVSVEVKQDAFKLNGLFLFHYPCVVGDAVTGEATMELHAGEMAIALGVSVKYFCGNLTDGSPTMTFAFFQQAGTVTKISSSISLKELTVRAAVYTNQAGPCFPFLLNLC